MVDFILLSFTFVLKTEDYLSNEQDFQVPCYGHELLPVVPITDGP